MIHILWHAVFKVKKPEKIKISLIKGVELKEMGRLHSFLSSGRALRHLVGNFILKMHF